MCDIQETKEEACKGRHAMSTCHTFQRVAMQVVQKMLKREHTIVTT